MSTSPAPRKLPAERVQFILNWLAERPEFRETTPAPMAQAAAGKQEEEA